MAQFQTMRHLQPSGMTPPGSEDLKALGGAEASVAGGGPPLKDPKGPFGLRHQQRERHGPYTTSPAKPVESRWSRKHSYYQKPWTSIPFLEDDLSCAFWGYAR